MADYITLMGAEDVKNAGHNMHSAAQDWINGRSNGGRLARGFIVE